MKYVSITPTKFMKDALKTSDTTLVLAHLISKGNDYVNACKDFKKAGGKIILDNSYYELNAPSGFTTHINYSTEELVERSLLVGADVLVVQDNPLRANTNHIVDHTIKKMKGLGFTGEFMCCVYARNRNFKEDVYQFKLLNICKYLDWIAIPYCFGIRKLDEFKRPEFLTMIEKEIGIGEIKKKIHLFGSNSFKYLGKEENRKWIYSIDGTMGWKCGYFKKKLPISVKDEPGRPKNYFDIKEIDDEQKECIDYNLNILKETCQKNG